MEMPGIGSNYPTNSLIYNGDIQSTVKVDFLNVAFRGSQNQSEATVFDAEAYSGSWWTSVSNFLRYKEVEETFGSREGASFELFGANRDKVRMTKDWLDFSAEHLSMWWKLVASSPQSIDKVIGIMTNYTLSRAKPGPGLKVPRETLVVVSYQERSNKELSKWSLAATISSHAAAGMGRIIVSGVLPQEKDLVEKVFDVIRSQFEPNPPELSFCLALNETTGDNGFVNINRTSLKKLRFVLLGKNVTEADVQCWLGDTEVVKTPEAKEYEPIMQSKWNYVYFTESDLLVTTRQYSLIALGQKLMDGFVLAPHRLQPLPHGSDFDDTDIRRIIPATGFFEHVQDIDSTVMSCWCEFYVISTILVDECTI